MGQIILSVAREELSDGSALDGQAYLIAHGQTTQIAPLDGVDTTIFGINDSGTAVGMNIDPKLNGDTILYNGSNLLNIAVVGVKDWYTTAAATAAAGRHTTPSAVSTPVVHPQGIIALVDDQVRVRVRAQIVSRAECHLPN